MPFAVPDLATVRRLNRDNLAAYLDGADATVPNAALRVLSDQNAGGAYLNLAYISWIAKNFLPDQSEGPWLDRWADILFGGRKAATYAAGTISATGTPGTSLPAGTILAASDATQYQTTAAVILTAQATPVPVRALTPGAIGNRDAGAPLTLSVAVAGVTAKAVVIDITGGADAESDDELRVRVLLRLRSPPMGGAATDYEQWALSIPGVTRVFVAPQEMGIGTVTVRFLLDDLRAANNGFPLADDLAAVAAYLDGVRPVTVADLFVLAPLAYPLAIRILNLSTDTPAMRAAIEAAVAAMLRERAAPGQAIFAAWLSAAVSEAVGDGSFDLVFADAVMPSRGHMAVLTGILYS